MKNTYLTESERVCDQQNNDNEISLIDLLLVLMRRKNLVISTVLVFVLFTIVYLLLTARMYQAEAILLPENNSVMQQLYTLKKELKIKNHDVTLSNQLVGKLDSNKLLADYFVSHEEGEKHDADKKTRNPVDINGLELKASLDDGLLKVTLTGSESEQLEEWLNGLIQYASIEVVDEELKSIESTFSAYKKVHEVKVKSMREIAKQQREDRIISLEEQLEIARKLNLREIIQGEISLDYMRGEKALLAEISILKNRKSDDAYIYGLREEQGKLRNIELLGDFDKTKINVVTIKQQAQKLSKPVKPNITKIVSLGVVFGIIVAIFVAFFVEFLKKTQRIYKTKSK